MEHFLNSSGEEDVRNIISETQEVCSLGTCRSRISRRGESDGQGDIFNGIYAPPPNKYILNRCWAATYMRIDTNILGKMGRNLAGPFQHFPFRQTRSLPCIVKLINCNQNSFCPVRNTMITISTNKSWTFVWINFPSTTAFCTKDRTPVKNN